MHSQIVSIAEAQLGRRDRELNACSDPISENWKETACAIKRSPNPVDRYSPMLVSVTMLSLIVPNREIVI